jgi:hypothetical protein
MFDACPEPEMDEADRLPPAPVRAEERMRLTRRMAEMGATIGEKLARQAVFNAEMTEVDILPDAQRQQHARRLDECAKTFAQVSRAVCTAVALEERIDQDLQSTPPPTEREEARERRRLAAVARRERAERRRQDVARSVEVVATAELPEPGDPVRRHANLHARIDRLLVPELADLDGFLRRPEGEIIARICRDLGLNPDWTLWNDPWADEAMAASAALGNRKSPSPSMGEGLGRGCNRAADDGPRERGGASPANRRQGLSPPPRPCPSPIEGEGFG